MRKVQAAIQVDIDDFAKLFRFHVGQSLVDCYASRIDSQIRTGEFANRRIHCGPHRGIVSDIHLEKRPVASAFTGRLSQ